MKLLLFTLAPLLAVIVSTNAYIFRPLVIWHGLGDSHSSPGMVRFANAVKEMYPGIFVHSIYIAEELDADRRASFYGNVNEQIVIAAEQLAGIEELQGGFDAIGFSQGGQFLRAYVERFTHDPRYPPINNLITFGSQHMGISDIPLCRPGDWLCQIARRATKDAVYGTWAQENLVQAQYFRDPNNLPTYLSANKFLTGINNEYDLPSSHRVLDTSTGNSQRNTTYARNLTKLNKLVLVIFERDRTVVPKESAWFGSEAPLDSDNRDSDFQRGRQKPLHPSRYGTTSEEKTIIPMRLQPLYVDDWIGLRTLDERGAVEFESCQGEHMDIGTGNCWKGVVGRWVGKA